MSTKPKGLKGVGSADDIKRYLTISDQQLSCHVCQKKFGVRRKSRRHHCRKCDHKVCEECSSQTRFDFYNNKLVRVCDHCIRNEHEITIS
eukprot:358709_1